MDTERCCVCGSETGRAGQADDSIFLDLPDGDSLGPLCEVCREEAQPYLERWENHADRLQAEIDRLQPVVAKLAALSDWQVAQPPITDLLELREEAREALKS